MNKRYLAALLLSLLIVLGYPYYLQWVGVAPPKKAIHEVTPLPLDAQPIFPSPPKPSHESKVLSYKNELYEILFSNRGGSIVLLRHGDTSLYKSGPSEEGIFGVRILHEDQDLSQEIFEEEPPQGKDAPPRFTYEKPGEYRISKQFFVGSENPALVLEMEIENLLARARVFSLELQYAMDLGLQGHPSDETSVKMVRFSAGEVHPVNVQAIRKGVSVTAESLEWHGLLRKYYTLLVKPDRKGVGQETRLEEDRLISRLKLDPQSLGPGEKMRTRLLIYAGPQRYTTLKEFGFGFEKILSQGIWGFLKIWVLIGLNFCYRLTANYGIAILLVTLLIKVLFTPLTHMSYESMQKMQALQPKIKALQKQHPKDPARLNKEMMELYKRNRVNPLGGCLPLVLQIPVFIVFYQVLSETVDLKGAPFIWWIRDLSEPDRLFTWPMAIPFVGNAFNLLPILMIGSMLWQQKLTPQTAGTPQQEKIMYFMPVIFGFVFYNLPSGLVLYWLVNNLLTIFHQLVIKRIPVILHHEDTHHESA